jgi:hypothetical protein
LADKRIEELEESLSNVRQLAANWQSRTEHIARAMTRDGICKMAHECALEIEDTFVRGGMSREQRLLNIEKAIRRRISIASCGESYWQD